MNEAIAGKVESMVAAGSDGNPCARSLEQPLYSATVVGHDSSRHDDRSIPLQPTLSCMPSYHAWLVDLDGTLYYPRPLQAVMAAELLLCGVRHAPLLRRFRIEHERLRGKGLGSYRTPYAAQIGHTAAATGRPPHDVERVVREWMQERPGKWMYRFRRTDLIRNIQAHRAAGGKTALVSDYPAQGKLDALQLTGLFDVVVASGEVNSPRALKPDPAGYLLAADLLGVSPPQCLVIGDRDDADGEAARRAAMYFLRV